jgi:RNA polymerase sigma-70 factor (ECF subfamily)
VVLLKEARRHTDAGLVQQCRTGDTEAFDELVRRYKDRVYNVIYRFLGNHEDALDVAQEVFVRAYRGIESFQGHAQVYTWLYSIAANLARNRLRDSSRKGRDQGASLEALQEAAPALAQTAAAVHETPRTAAQRHELDAALRHCLDQLPEVYRLAFVLRIFDGLCYEDIASSAGCPAGTVKSRLNQARKLLRECLEKQEVL